MIEPLLSDDALLADIDSVHRTAGRVDLWWLCQSGYLVQHDRTRILIDPYLSDSLTRKYANTEKPHVRMSRRVIDPARLRDISIITTSHGHTDHLDAETLSAIRASHRTSTQAGSEVLRRAGSNAESIAASPDGPSPIPRLIAPIAIKRLATERWGGEVDVLMDAFESWSVDDLTIRAVPSSHPTLDRDDHGHHLYLGYLFRIGPFTIYHSGDTMLFPGMEQMLIEQSRGQIDLAILPINGKVGNMTGGDAARLAKAIDAKLVIPCHYDLFEFNTADPAERFVPQCQRLGQAFRVLRLGERLTLEREVVK